MRLATVDLPDFAFHLYKFYVDDHNLVVEALPAGARLGALYSKQKCLVK